MKLLKSFRSNVVVLLVCLFFLPLKASAEELKPINSPDIPDSIVLGVSIGSTLDKLWNYVRSVVKQTAETYADETYEFNPDLPNTMVANIPQANVQNQVLLKARLIDLCQSYVALPMQNKSAHVPEKLKHLFKQTGLEATLSSKFLRLKCRDVLLDEPNVGNNIIAATDSIAISTATKKQDSPVYTANESEGYSVIGNSNFSFEMFLNPFVVTPESRYAKNFIRFLSGFGEYKSLFSSLTAEDMVDKPSAKVDDFMQKLRAYVTLQSVGLSNLNSLMIERMPDQKVRALNLKDGEDDVITPEQYRRYMMTRRTRDQQWFEQVNQESPAVIARKTLLVLTEIQAHLYKMEQTNERLLATLSAMQLQGLSKTKEDLIKRAKKIKNPQYQEEEE